MGQLVKEIDRVMSSIMDDCGGSMNRDRMPHLAGTSITGSEHKEEHSSGSCGAYSPVHSVGRLAGRRGSSPGLTCQGHFHLWQSNETCTSSPSPPPFELRGIYPSTT